MEFALSLLNKFDGSRLSSFLKLYIEEYDNKLREVQNAGKSGKEGIQEVLKDSLTSMTKENLDEIEDGLFSFLFYQDQDTYYHKKIIKGNNFLQSLSNIRGDTFFSRYMDRKLYNVPNEFGLISIRQEGNDLLLLFNFGTYVTKVRNDEKQFLISCRLNIETDILSIGIKDSLFSNVRAEDKLKFGGKRHSLVSTIVEEIEKLKLDINIINFQEGNLETILYKMFLSESDKAISLIKDSLEQNDGENRSIDDFETMAAEFLAEQFVLKNPEKFIDRALSLKYQDQAEQMPITSFVNSGGYIFGFSFVEKQVTRSNNKSDKKKPIYQYKLYWSLKEIIDEYPNISQLAMYWKFNKNNFEKKVAESTEGELLFVELEYKIWNNELIFHYFVNSENMVISKLNSNERKLKEDYALRKIIQYL